MTSYPLRTYPSRIDREIVKLLLALKEATDAEYPSYLYSATRAEFLQQVTTKKVGTADTVPTRT